MLDELKNLKYRGGKEGLLFFFCDVIGQRKITIQDAEVICSHAPGRLKLNIRELISYCLAFSWIKKETNAISLSPSFAVCMNDRDKLNGDLIVSTVEKLFAEEVFSSCLFSYDAVCGHYMFKNELLPLSLSAIRNTLISQGFFTVLRNNQGTKFYIAPTYVSLVAKHCKEKRKQLSIEQLKKRLEDNEKAGEKAELFVLSFEKERIGQPLCKKIKRISEIDSAAGYDIVSFNSLQSQEPNRFIEVKAVSNAGFFWSKNECEIAKLKGKSYYLYLVELDRIGEPGYAPEMIQDPVSDILESRNWLVEAQSYHIQRV